MGQDTERTGNHDATAATAQGTSAAAARRRRIAWLSLAMTGSFLFGTLFRVHITIKEIADCPGYDARLVNPDRRPGPRPRNSSAELVTANRTTTLHETTSRLANERLANEGPEASEETETCGPLGYLSGDRCIIDLGFPVSKYKDLACALAGDVIMDKDGYGWRTLHCEFHPV